MQFKVKLKGKKGASLPINYQYPLSACIYKIIERADAGFAEFLHDTGFQYKAKRFKFFTFSDLMVACSVSDGNLVLKSEDITLYLAFEVPKAAEAFIVGLFRHQNLEIANRNCCLPLQVISMEVQPGLINDSNAANPRPIIRLRPLSAVVTGPKNEAGNYSFCSPESADFTYWLLHNWKEKYAALHGADKAEEKFRQVSISVKPGKNQIRSRLMTIKEGSAEQTRIKGYLGFELEIIAPHDVLELGLNAGLGLYNAMGCGYVEQITH